MSVATACFSFCSFLYELFTASYTQSVVTTSRDRPKAILLASAEAESEPECKPKLPVRTSAEAVGGRSGISVYVSTNEVNIIPDNNKKLKNVHEIFLNYTKQT